MSTRPGSDFTSARNERRPGRVGNRLHRRAVERFQPFARTEPLGLVSLPWFGSRHYHVGPREDQNGCNKGRCDEFFHGANMRSGSGHFHHKALHPGDWATPSTVWLRVDYPLHGKRAAQLNASLSRNRAPTSMVTVAASGNWSRSARACREGKRPAVGRMGESRQRSIRPSYVRV